MTAQELEQALLVHGSRFMEPSDRPPPAVEATLRQRNPDERAVSQMRSDCPASQYADAESRLHQLDDRFRELDARELSRLDTGGPQHFAQHRVVAAVDRVEDEVLVPQFLRRHERLADERMVRRDDDHMFVLEQRRAPETSLVDVTGDDRKIESAIE